MQVKDVQRATQRETAAALGVTTRTIRGWHEYGIPRNEDLTYSIPAVVAWRIAVESERADSSINGNENSPAIERWRTARAILAELDVQERKRELIPVSEVGRDIGVLIEWFKTGLLGQGNKLAATMAALDRPEDCCLELDRENRELLADLKAGLERLIAADEGELVEVSP